MYQDQAVILYSHYKTDWLLSVPRTSKHFILPLQNSRPVILYSKTCTPFPINDKVPLQIRQAIKCAKAKQSFYTPRHVHPPFLTRIKTHYKTDWLSSVLQASQAVILCSTTCTHSFPHNDKVPLQIRQEIKCAKAKHSFYTPRQVHLPFPTRIKSNCKLDRI